LHLIVITLLLKYVIIVKKEYSMTSLSTIKNTLIQIKPFLQRHYNISSLSIFGSYAREEETITSDIDLLVDFTKTPDLLTFIEIEEYLSKKLKQPVDLVPKRKLKAQLKNQILQEAIAV